MKVCDLALFSPDTSSGVKTYITDKIAYVAGRDDVEHVVIVPGKEDRVCVQARTKMMVVRGMPSPYPGLRVGMNLGRIARLVERESPDIIELNCQYTLPWAALLATRRRRTPIVGIYHTDVPACARHLARHAGPTVARAVERITEFYEGLIYRHCTVTVMLNAAMHHRLQRLGVMRMRCLPCGVDVAMFHPGRRDLGFRTRLGLAANQTILLYVGRLSAEKELELLFAAYERLSPHKFVLLIAGDGPDAPSVRRHAAVRPGIRDLGHIESRADLATIYASSDIFVVPGRYETFGIATLEAIACGLPVVGIQDSGTAALVPPRIGKMARAGDAVDLAATIAAVAAWSPDSTRAIGHAFAAETFARDIVFDQYFSLYRDLIDWGPARRPPG